MKTLNINMCYCCRWSVRTFAWCEANYFSCEWMKCGIYFGTGNMVQRAEAHPLQEAAKQHRMWCPILGWGSRLCITPGHHQSGEWAGDGRDLAPRPAEGACLFLCLKGLCTTPSHFKHGRQVSRGFCCSQGRHRQHHRAVQNRSWI